MKKLLSMWVIASAMVFVSCDKSDDGTPDNNITGIVNSNPNFSLLALAINRAGLASTINSSTNVTVFAPDNEAFAASNLNEAAINSLPAETLAGILKYHVLDKAIGSADVPATGAVTTLEGKNVYVSKNTNGVFVNGVRVKTADVAADNGVIHIIDRVLTPPTQSIAEIVSSNPQFSILLAAVGRAGLATAVSSPGNFTVFAPGNTAFNNAGFANAAAINSADQALITNVVKYHVVGANVFASDIVNNANVNSLQGAALQVSTSPSIKIASSSNPVSNITTTNIVATNGVVHIIDRVLLP